MEARRTKYDGHLLDSLESAVEHSFEGHEQLIDAIGTEEEAALLVKQCGMEVTR